MRNLADVIDQIVEVSTNEELNGKLEKIKSDIFFTAPEVMPMRWDLVSEALEESIPMPLKTDEHVKIISIFTTFPEEKVKVEFGKEFD